MNNTDKPHGFAGLSDLASDITTIPDAKHPEPPKIPPKPPQATPSSSVKSETERKDSICTPPTENVSPPPIETVSGGKSGSNIGGWIFGIIAIALVIWLASTGEENKKESSDNPPQPTQNYSLPQTTTPPVKNRGANSDPRLEYKKPPVGTNNVLSTPQIRWCIREHIRLETLEKLIDSDAGVRDFNRIVDDYNRRCAKYRYSKNSHDIAQREVEAYRGQIVAEAIKDAGKLGQPHQSTNTVRHDNCNYPFHLYWDRFKAMFTSKIFDNDLFSTVNQ